MAARAQRLDHPLPELILELSLDAIVGSEVLLNGLSPPEASAIQTVVRAAGSGWCLQASPMILE